MMTVSRSVQLPLDDTESTGQVVRYQILLTIAPRCRPLFIALIVRLGGQFLHALFGDARRRGAGGLLVAVRVLSAIRWNVPTPSNEYFTGHIRKVRLG